MIFNPTIIKKGGGYGAYNVNSVLLEDGTQELQITTATEKPVSKLAQVVDRTVTEITAEDVEGATSIGNSVFASCKNLQSIIIPNTVTSLGNASFFSCSNLSNIILSNNITKIYDQCFYSCSSLSKIIIYENIQIISSQAFLECTSLANVTIKSSTPPTLGASVFTNTSPDLKIYVPAESVEAYKTATNWVNYADKIFAIE